MVKQRDAELSKARILEEAEKQFADLGLEGASVNVIAEKAEINKRMIYHYFESKEGLYLQVLKKNFEKIYDMEKHAFTKEKDIISSIEKGIRYYYHFLNDNPAYVKIITREELSGGHYLHQLIPDTLLFGFEKLMGIYEEGVEKEILKKDQDLMQMIISINAMCFIPFTRKEMLKNIWGKDFDKKMEERLDHICDLIILGLKK